MTLDFGEHGGIDQAIQHTSTCIQATLLYLNLMNNGSRAISYTRFLMNSTPLLSSQAASYDNRE
jgi:hypothetical protein